MTTDSRFVDEAKRRIETLAATHPELADGFTSAELDNLGEFARALEPAAADADRAFRLYLEIKQEVRKDRFVLLGILPALATLAAMRGKKVLMLVAESPQGQLWLDTARGWSGNFDGEVTTWGSSTRRLGGVGGEHSSCLFLGDIDTLYPAGSKIPFSLGNGMVDAMDKLLRNGLADFLLIHQVGKMAVQPG